jgi:hypothetical protein
MKKRRVWIWLTVAIAIAVSGLLVYTRVFSGNTVQQLRSPDGRTIAYVRTYGALSAMDGDAISVELRAAHSPIRHSVFYALDYGTAVNIEWANTRELLVECKSCRQMAVYGSERRWNDMVIHYKFADGSPTYPATTFHGGIEPCVP